MQPTDWSITMPYTPNPNSFVGRTVAFMLNEGHVKQITEKRIARGTASYQANPLKDGQAVAGIIINDWYEPLGSLPQYLRHEGVSQEDWEETIHERSLRRTVNIRLLLDGTDDLWLTSVQMFDPNVHISMLKPQTAEESRERQNVYIQGKQTVDYWLDAGWTDPEVDARGHWWFPETA